MPLSQSELRALAAAASSIPERLSYQLLQESEQVSDEMSLKRLRAWCQISTCGDWRRFQERLLWDGLDLPGALRLLSSSPWPAHAPLPGWTTTLQDALFLLETVADENGLTEKSQWPFLDPGSPLPFEELLSPFVLLAARRLRTRAGEAADRLTETAHLTLQRHLLQALTSLAVPTLQAELTRSRAQDVRGPQDYQHFLQRMGRGGLSTLLQSYSVLARLLATTCDLWVEANVEFIQRLQADWSELVSIFFGAGNDPGPVTEIQPALSDMHAGRRATMALTFALEYRLIYKPRPVGMEEAYARLLQWCNAQDITPQLKSLTILNRASYGWVEFVAHEPCRDHRALRCYYRRAGMVLFLVYLLGGMNCFYDHLIAHGEQPVLVNASHLLHPYPAPNPQQNEGEDWEQEIYSVLHTGLLASWQLPPAESSSHIRETKHAAADISGLCVRLEPHACTDENRQHLPEHPSLLKYGSLKAHAQLNIASSIELSESLCAEDLQAELSIGFQRMYQVFLRHRATLLGAESPLHAMKAQRVHMPYRDRSAYERLFPKLLAPQALRDAVTRSILLEGLGNDDVPVEWFRAGTCDQAHWWPVFAAEREALLQGDIPAISVHASSDALLVSSDKKIEACLCRPPFDLMLRRLEHLGDEDLARQLVLLQQIAPGPVLRVASDGESSERSDSPHTSPETFMAQAIAIADEITGRAIECGQEGVCWVKPEASYRFEQSQLRPMRYGFSDGVSGIAFFLAALAHRTGESRYRRIAQAALRPFQHLLREEPARLAYEMGLGAAFGLGSVVYALTRISQFLEMPELLADARTAAGLISSQLVAQDRLLDVFVGSAGAILGLLALYEVTPEQEYLERALCCGRRLLHARTPSKVGCLAWPARDGTHMTGFSHGSAGIVYALLRLSRVTGDTAFLEAAQEGLRYEDRALVREKGNWAGEVGEEVPSFGLSWCHGAPGIGLARVGGLRMLDTPSIRRDIDLALQTTLGLGISGPDHLCCGVCGRVEFLLTAAHRLGRPELADMAARFAGDLLARAEQRAGFTFGSFLPAWVARPQFLHGTAGIGYTLLRLAQLDRLPSPLLWE